MSIGTHGVPSGVGFDSQMEDAQRSLDVNADMVRCLLPEFDQVSITVVDDTGGISTCAQAGDVVTDLDQLQYGMGEGPCVDSLRSAVPVAAPHIQRDERWRRYVSSAAELGLKSQLAAPVQWGEHKPMGALNMYSTTRDDIAPTASLIAQAIAAQIAAALANLRTIENLHNALATRTIIGQATGLLMAQYELSETAAFALLRRRSSHANVKLRDIAAQIVAERSGTGRELPSAAIC